MKTISTTRCQKKEKPVFTEVPGSFSDPENLIGMCGVFCRGCPAYQVRCHGCRSTDSGPRQKRRSKWQCKKRACIIEKALNHCGECAKLSCALRHPLEKRYLENYRIDLAENCRQIKIMGAQPWIKAQRERYTCNKCGLFFSPYDQRCPKCTQTGGT